VISFNSSLLHQIIVCPDCQGPLKVRPQVLDCEKCARAFHSNEHGIINLLPLKHLPEPLFYDDDFKKNSGCFMNSFHAMHYRPHTASGMLEEYFKDEMMKLVVDDGSPAFDIGCGPGMGFEKMGYSRNDIIGIDIKEDLLVMAKKKYPKADCIRCDIIFPPFKFGTIKKMFSLSTLEHIFYLERFVENLEKLLHDQGRLYVMIPNEGGLLWKILRNISHFKYSRAFNVNYKKLLEKEHCNKAITVENVLNKYFTIEKKRQRPLPFGGFNLSFISCYRLKKRM
jgi:SAM-dependent methyltransferase